MNKMVKLSELCIKITDGSHFSPKGIKKGYPMLSSKDMDDMDFNFSDIKYISSEDYKKMVDAGCKPMINDVLIIKDGNSYLKKVFVIREEREIVILSSIGILRPNTELLDPYYLRYYLLSNHVKNEVAKKYVTGSALPRIILKNFGEIEIPYIELFKQKKVVSILKKIDNKIENNNKINKELENIAKTIYDYWFLQFDFPDENGKPYKSSGGKMVWNEELKKEIPEGWEVQPILNIVNWQGASQPPKDTFIYEPREGFVRFIQNRDYDNNDNVTFIPENLSNKRCDKYDIMIDKYGDKTAGTIRYGLEGAYNVALAKIEILYNNMQEYIRSYLSSNTIFNYLHNACTASTRSSLNEKNLCFLKLPIPSENVLNKYEKFSKNIINKILENKKQNEHLTSFRDFLLPLLMNGQVGFKKE